MARKSARRMGPWDALHDVRNASASLGERRENGFPIRASAAASAVHKSARTAFTCAGGDPSSHRASFATVGTPPPSRNAPAGIAAAASDAAIRASLGLKACILIILLQ